MVAEPPVAHHSEGLDTIERDFTMKHSGIARSSLVSRSPSHSSNTHIYIYIYIYIYIESSSKYVIVPKITSSFTSIKRLSNLFQSQSWPFIKKAPLNHEVPFEKVRQATDFMEERMPTEPLHLRQWHHRICSSPQNLGNVSAVPSGKP